MKIRVLLVDGHRLVRQGLRSLLDQCSDIKIVGEADDGPEAVELARRLRLDVVVLDLQKSKLSRAGAARQLLAADPRPKVICLSAEKDLRAATEELRAGALGYVLHEADFRDLADAIRAGMRGEVYLSLAVVQMLTKDFARSAGAEPDSPYGGLSDRELTVLQVIADGNTTKEIARHLLVSAKAVESHRCNTMRKLQVDSIAGLTLFALRHGLTSR
ncbi:MAG TPA: response regulator transcription factor [Tepidisphaeraceae bacterium]|jgi:DNA-binding NarL/FixJ family response regulator|nr:response regulator transcription factor [Tepidisphaeraceae bacterium]